VKAAPPNRLLDAVRQKVVDQVAAHCGAASGQSHLGPSHRLDRLDVFVAATDLFLWKLLRRDLDRSQDKTRNVLAALLEGLTGPNHPRP